MRSLKVENLTKQFGNLSVLSDINFSIEEGEFLVLVGPSGCGKSTLLNLICGLETASSGKIFIGGKDVTQLPPAQRDIAMVFQSYALYPNMTVAKNISFGMEMRKIKKDIRERKVLEIAELLQISNLLNRKPSQLSGGQRQRVAMGRALVRSPKIFLFDEPLSNLDAKLRVEMRSEIKKLYSNLNATIVYVTHDQIEAMTMASKIIILSGGIIQQIGTPYDLYNNPANTFVATFMGSLPMNLIACEVESTSADSAKIRLSDGSKLVIKNKHLKKHAKLKLAIRPEDIKLQLSEESKGSSQRSSQRGNLEKLNGNSNEHSSKQSYNQGSGYVFAKVAIHEPTGADTIVECIIGSTKVNCRVSGTQEFRIDQKVKLSFDDEKIRFFDDKTGAMIS